MNVALCPIPKLQFSDANGVPLAGGLLYTYAAGTTTPQATYADGAGMTANPNPVVLDAGGFASVFLTANTYKLVLTDANGVAQWTQDNVSAVSLAELTGNTTLASLSVSGNVTVGGNGTVDGSLTAASLSVTGAASVGGTLTAANASVTNNFGVSGTLTAATANVTGNETVGGALTVSGAASVASLSIGGSDAAAFVNALIAGASSLAGTLVLSGVNASPVSGGYWLVFTFGTVAGTRVQVAIGSGLAGNGFNVPMPSGFISTNAVINVAINGVAAVAGNLENCSCSITANVISVSGLDSGGHTPTMTVMWNGVAWRTGY